MSTYTHLTQEERYHTIDNGREFCMHTEIAKALGCETYFAKPYHSWERGLNENHNDLLRKSLNYRTPWEVFNDMTNQYFDSFPSVALNDLNSPVSIS